MTVEQFLNKLVPLCRWVILEWNEHDEEDGPWAVQMKFRDGGYCIYDTMGKTPTEALMRALAMAKKNSPC